MSSVPDQVDARNRAGPKRVYLDTQDFSRFGDVVRGKADGQMKELFEFLLAKAESGEVRFLFSMITLSELLQYHPDFEETTLARAEAVELLCRGWCCINPSRLMAREAARILRGEGVDLPSVVQPRNNWTPNLANVFEDFEERLGHAKSSLVGEFATMNRKTRRIAEKGASDRAFSKLLADVAPAIAAEYGLSKETFLGSFLLRHKKRISSEEASQRLFSAVASPKGFIHTYLKKYDGDKTFPQWVGRAGQTIRSGFEVTVSKLQAMPSDAVKRHWSGAFEQLRPEISRLVLSLALAEIEEFGLSEEEFRSLDGNPTIQRVPSIQVSVDVMKAYLEQAIGIHGTKASIERGFGGDVLHSLYIPFVDVWRSDRRFSNLARTISGSTTICGRLNDLPDLI